MYRERIAAEIHAIWSDWMGNLFDQCGFETKTIPDELWHNWVWRMALPWDRLTPGEQESNRQQVDRIIAAIIEEE